MNNGICKCTNPEVIPTSTSNPCSQRDCLVVPHLLVKAADSVYPCGDALVIDISDKIGFDLNQDKSIATFRIVSADSNATGHAFTTDAENDSIEISLTSAYSGYPEPDYKFHKFTYKVQQGDLSGVGTITVVFKSHCSDVDVPSGKYCDPCTGNLADLPTNLVVSDDDSNTTNISVT